MDSALDDLTKKLGATAIPLNGVEFAGKGLKLDNAEDAKPVIDAINNLEGPLELLNLEGNTIGVPAAEAIAKVLQDKHTLRHAIWKDMFTSRSKTEIPPALCALSKSLIQAGARLEVLDLSDNASGPIGVDGISELLSSEVCWGLKELKLANMGLGVTGAEKLASALQKCLDNSKAAGSPFSLKVFIAGRNRLENDGSIALAKVFKQIGTLEEIQIYQNGIYHDGFKVLCEAFVKNPNLKKLNLNDNTITAKGAVHLSAALKCLPQLASLNVGDCLLLGEGATMIANVIKDGLPRLEELVMNSNEISGSAGVAIAAALANKKNLKTVQLGENSFGSQLEYIEELIKRQCSSNPDFHLSLSDDEGSADEDGDGTVDDDEYEHGDYQGEEDYQGEGENDDDYEDEEDDDEDGESDDYSGDDYYNEVHTTPMRRNLDAHQPPSPQIFQRADSPVTQLEDDLHKIMVASGAADSGAAVDLYRKLFGSADESTLGQINNLLPAYLGLLKLEKKDLAKQYNKEECLKVAEKAMSLGIFHKSTQALLSFIIEERRKRVLNNN
ncbi:ran GTPase-activating protein [Nesidiocoris tenuis]|uniref:Ran GTPase-activating protein n=1 Tax=Nesidiocoris tenuis TaxID=355587 RepID=A0ABN7B633_9HEMI|nr:ran GTPase-activating protein [Nesidiocoris tenuis]